MDNREQDELNKWTEQQWGSPLTGQRGVPKISQQPGDDHRSFEDLLNSQQAQIKQLWTALGTQVEQIDDCVDNDQHQKGQIEAVDARIDAVQQEIKKIWDSLKAEGKDNAALVADMNRMLLRVKANEDEAAEEAQRNSAKFGKLEELKGNLSLNQSTLNSTLAAVKALQEHAQVFDRSHHKLQERVDALELGIEGRIKETSHLIGQITDLNTVVGKHDDRLEGMTSSIVRIDLWSKAIEDRLRNIIHYDRIEGVVDKMAGVEESIESLKESLESAWVDIERLDDADDGLKERLAAVEGPQPTQIDPEFYHDSTASEVAREEAFMKSPVWTLLEAREKERQAKAATFDVKTTHPDAYDAGYAAGFEAATAKFWKVLDGVKRDGE